MRATATRAAALRGRACATLILATLSVAATALLGCESAPRTQIVVAIGSSLEPGVELGSIVAEVRDPSDGGRASHTFTIACEGDRAGADGRSPVAPPFSFTILPRNEAQIAREIELTLTARDGEDRELPPTTVPLRFERGKLLAAPFSLTGAGFLAAAVREEVPGGELEGLPSPACVSADAGIDAGLDAGEDAGRDAGEDAGVGDGGTDAGPPPPVVTLLFPWNGYTTGSIHAPTSLTNHARKPELRWEPVAGATGYRVRLATGCPMASYRICDLARQPGAQLLTVGAGVTRRRATSLLPVSTVRPVGARFFWRVEADLADGSTSVSEVRYLDVGRQRTDLDGDGYADIVVGCPDCASSVGRVEISFGEPGWMPPGTRTYAFINSGTDPGRFGASVSAGDLDADGYGDLIIGAPMSSPAGTAHVRFGASTPGSGIAVSLTPPGTAMATGGSSFGAAVAYVGDVDGDGYGDLVVGAPSYEMTGSGAFEHGVAFLYLGGPTGLRSPSMPLVIANPTPDTNDHFGAAIAGLGDLDGDGLADFAIGAPEASEGGIAGGAVYVYRGALGAAPTVPSAAIPASSSQLGAYFGAAVGAAGDLDGDGFADLIVGSPNRPLGGIPNLGRASVLYGARGPLVGRVELDNPLGVSDAPPGYFGASVTGLGPHPETGLGALAAGGPAMNGSMDASNAGLAYVYFGMAARALTATGPLRSASAPFNSEVGRAVAGVGDINGDGNPDLVVGAPFHAGSRGDRTGLVLVYQLNGSAAVTLPNYWESPTFSPNGRFGDAIAGASP